LVWGTLQGKRNVGAVGGKGETGGRRKTKLKKGRELKKWGGGLRSIREKKKSKRKEKKRGLITKKEDSPGETKTEGEAREKKTPQPGKGESQWFSNETKSQEDQKK